MNVTLIPLINGARLEQNIIELSQIGNLTKGGVSRLAFSLEDLQARQLVHQWMEAAGMTVRVDAAGNLIGHYAGKHPELGVLATGSHIDTVAVGGRYDGVLGVLAGIEVVRTLRDNNIRLEHPIEVIVFTDEENTVIGCKSMAGTLNLDPEMYRRLDGRDIQSCLEKIGGNWSKIATAKRNASDLVAFVELHVEQGGVLESEGKDIGVVKGIVGQYRFLVTVTGRANHAGTTPMHLRRDALIAASRIVLAVNNLATSIPGEQVATVGMMNVHPNATNTVPEKVELSIDMRDLSLELLTSLISLLEAELTVIAAETRTEIVLKRTLEVLPTLAHVDIQSAIVRCCEELGASYTYLPSRAGHDAQEIGRFTAMGMIFVPSLSGISHSEDEYTSPEQCILGTNVLLHTLIELDKVKRIY
jgi:beta-ureidopropionase / N-carbamoyl-L-amino-acid hydrolase